MRPCLSLIALICMLTACGTRRSTGYSRFYHSFTARYNAIYNAQEAYDEARHKQLRHSSTSCLLDAPLDLSSPEFASDYKQIVERCERTILRHSLRAKPQGVKTDGKNKEYNPAMYRAWLLLGKSQFYNASFTQAENTFAHIRYLYEGDAKAHLYALLWQIRTLIALSRTSDAEVLLSDLSSEEIRLSDKATRQLYSYILAELALRTRRYTEAERHIHELLEYRQTSEAKARLYWVLALISSQISPDLSTAHKLYKRAKHHSLNEAFRQSVDSALRLSPEESKDFISQFVHKPEPQPALLPMPDRFFNQAQVDSLSPKPYPIDWSRIYSDSIALVGEGVVGELYAKPYVIFELPNEEMSLNELLFALSSFNFKSFTQHELAIRLHSSTAEKYTLIITSFAPGAQALGESRGAFIQHYTERLRHAFPTAHIEAIN